MDINLVSLFPELFLRNLVNNIEIGLYFLHIDNTIYQHMMSRMILMLLGNENMTHEVAQRLHNHHAHMKLTRKEYKVFMDVFNATMQELGFPEQQIHNVNLRIKTIVLQIYNIRHNHQSDMIQTIIDCVNTTKDLNTIRTNLIHDLHILQEQSYRSDVSICKQDDHQSYKEDIEGCVVVDDA
jgi:hypothetical protein